MHCLPHKLIVVALTLPFVAAPLLRANEREQREATSRVKYLIELLASKNSAPDIRGNAKRGEDPSIAFDEGYDESLQVPVYLAITALLAEEEVAIDLLLAHRGDDRYSFSVNSFHDRNVTVSDACGWIAREKLKAFEEELHVITRSQFGIYPVDSEKSFSTWWSRNKERGLAALQVEAIDAAIKFMAAVDGKKALPWHAQAEPLPLEEFNRLRDENLKTLKAIRESIVATGTPYQAKTLDSAHGRIFGLPWTSRRFNR